MTNEQRACLDRTVYQEGNIVERLINRLMQFRRSNTLREVVNFLAMVTIAAILPRS